MFCEVLEVGNSIRTNVATAPAFRPSIHVLIFSPRVSFAFFSTFLRGRFLSHGAHAHTHARINHITHATPPSFTMRMKILWQLFRCSIHTISTGFFVCSVSDVMYKFLILLQSILVVYLITTYAQVLNTDNPGPFFVLSLYLLFPNDFLWCPQQIGSYI